MKKVKFTGEFPSQMPTLGIDLKPGDVIDVADDFEHPLFVDVVKQKGGELTDATTK